MNLNYDTNAGGNFKPTPAGLHNARIVQIIDLGTQNESGFNGGPPKAVKRIRWTFELVDTNEVFDPIKGPQPMFISKKYTKSLAGNSNNLRKDITSLRGTPVQQGETINLGSFLNMPCMIQVIHEASKSDATKVYAKIIAVMPAQNPAAVAPLRNPPVFFDMDSPTCVQEYQKINGKVLETIHASPEFQALVRSGRIQQRVIQPRQQNGQQQQAPANNGYMQMPPQQQYQQPVPQQQQPGAWQPPAQPWQQQAQNFQQTPVQNPAPQQQPAWGQQNQQPPVQNTPPVQPWVGHETHAPNPQQQQQPPVWNPQNSAGNQQGSTYGTPQPGQPINQPPYNHPLNHVPNPGQAIPPAGYKHNPFHNPNVVGSEPFVLIGGIDDIPF